MGGGEEEEGEEDSSVGFQYVNRKQKSNRKRRNGKNNVAAEEARDESKVDKRQEIVLAKKSLLINGEVGIAFQLIFDRVFNSKADVPKYILALGLGSVKDSKAAQLQLAFLLLVRDRLASSISSNEVDNKGDGQIQVEAYDPIFDDEDRELLSSFKIRPVQYNLQGRHTFQHSTFVYMPHCTKTLYENLLRSNWTSEGLSRLFLCCNDLERYSDRRDSDHLTPCIKRIVPKLKVEHLPLLPSPHKDALNDLAIQVFDDTYESSPDPMASITNRLGHVDLQTENEANDFWILPLEKTSTKDPELI